MKKQLQTLLIGALLALPASVYAQCTATITSSAGCAPTTLTVNASFQVASIIWLFNGTDTIQTYFAKWQNSATTVAGGNGDGTDSTHISEGWLGDVDSLGNVYVADANNNRVQKWAPGATYGVTVAGNGILGDANDQLSGPRGCFGLNNGTVYAGDENNNRVMEWLSGATTGTVVAGGNGQGTASNQLNTNYGVFVDKAGNVYVGDWPNNRIQKCAPGADTGITVAGGNGAGNASNQLNAPYSCFVDDSGNVYAADVLNYRIQKWAPGADTGITVAAGNGYGSSLTHLAFPYASYVDKAKNVYIADQGNSRIVVWTPGATQGVVVAGGQGPGPAAYQLHVPSGVWLDDSENIYVSDQANYRVQKFALDGIVDTLAAASQGTYTAIVTGFNGCRDTVVYVPSLNTGITAAGATTFCSGDSLKLTSATGTGYSYQWLLNGSPVSGASDSTYMATASGNYDVVVSNANCTDTAQPVAVTVNPSPTPVITVSGNVLSTTSGYTTYQWYLDNQAISGATTSTYTSAQAGHYTVVVTSSNGCSGTSAVQPLAVGNINGYNPLSIYPNPTSSVIYISNAPQNAHISVMSADGREVVQKDNVKQIDLSQFADGVYIIKVTTNEGQVLKIDKLIKTTGN